MSDADDRPARRGPAAWWAAYRSWPRLGRFTLLGVVGLLVLAIVVGTTTAMLVRRPLPQTGGELEIPGLEGTVDIVRDASGVPHLYADSMADLMLAQGYVHAQERFFEMDVRRHATAGRLAEMFGEEALDSDRAVRTMGWRRIAEQEVALVSPETRMALEAYADGVNAYIEPRGTTELGAQYTLLRLGGLEYTPEPWQPADSLAWLKAVAWDLRSNLAEEVERALAVDRVGARRASELFPPYPFDEHETVVSGGAVVDGVYEPDAEEGGTRLPTRPPPGWPGTPRAALEATGRALDAAPTLLGAGDGLGSNAWVVSGEHTESGKPLLANDPHLGVSLPGVWMQVGLHCRERTDECPMNVSGFSYSGFPGVVVGHNDRIAWGVTNLAPDVADLFVERVQGKKWLYDGELRPLRIRRERIRVRDGDDVRLRVRETRHGPLLSDVDAELGDVASARAEAVPRDPLTGAPGSQPEPGDPEAPEPTDDGEAAEYAVALRWTALRPGRSADSILAVDQARSWREFRAAARSFAVPSQNLLYADVEGHIGYQAPGRIPIRKSGNDGRTPVAGWRPENDWSDQLVPFDGLPQVLDPEEGFLASANQAVIGPDYPYFLTDDWDYGYRSERIRQLLEERIAADAPLTAEDMTEIQLDTRNPMAPLLVPLLLEVELPEGYFSDGQRLLEDWDFTQPPDSGAAAYYNAVWDNILEIGFHDDLPATAWPRGGDRWFAVVTRLLDKPRSRWWDDRDTDTRREDLDDVLEKAMRDARDELTRELARNADHWEWGRLHSLELEGVAIGQSDNGLATGLVNRGPWHMSGGSSIVNATGWDAVEGFEVVTAPSMRMVVDLDDLDASRWINMTGVSGHPGSDHYTDQTDLWAEGETLPWAFSRAEVEAVSEDILRLAPGSEEDGTPSPGED